MYFSKSTTICFLYFLSFLLCFQVSQTGAAVVNMITGVKYVFYDNPFGTTSTGDCCDEPKKKAGSCSANRCDTAFRLCGTSSHSSTPCDVVPKQLTPTTPNSNSFTFGNTIGTGSKKRNRIVFKLVPYVSNINFTIEAMETPNVVVGSAGLKSIAKFNFLVNRVDPNSAPPTFRKLVLKDGYKTLVVEAFSMCGLHYYGPTCSVYCKSQTGKYTCSKNGDVQCLPGFFNPICTTTTSTTTTTTTTTTTKTTTTNTSKSGNQSSHSGSSSSGSGDDEDSAGLAAGLSVGFVLLLVVVAGLSYYYAAIRGKQIVKNSQVDASDNRPTGTPVNA